MSKIQKFSLALSCFAPLYVIFVLKNSFQTIKLLQRLTTGGGTAADTAEFYAALRYNGILLAIWLVLILVSVLGILCFSGHFLDSKKLAKENIILVKADNVTAEYYFTYFALFVLSFFTIDPTAPEGLPDIIIFGLLLFLMLWVYMINDMYFINPVLNLIGYKAFHIAYRKNLPQKQQTTDKAEAEQLYEIKVFSKRNLNREIGNPCFVTFSPHDFSVCYPAAEAEKSDR